MEDEERGVRGAEQRVAATSHQGGTAGNEDAAGTEEEEDPWRLVDATLACADGKDAGVNASEIAAMIKDTEIAAMIQDTAATRCGQGGGVCVGEALHSTPGGLGGGEMRGDEGRDVEGECARESLGSPAADAQQQQQQQQQQQVASQVRHYLHFCTSKASKLKGGSP